MKTIQVTVAPDGSIKIEGVGFKGAECEKATKFLEDALGVTADRKRKPEYHQGHTNRQQQGAG